MRNKLVMLCCLTIFLSSLMPAVATTKTITAENTDEKNGLLKWVEVEYGEETMQEIEKYIELSKTSSDFTKSTNNLEKAEDEIPIIKKLEAEIGEEKIKEINAEIEFQKTLPDVVKAMPYKALAAASPEAQKAHLGYIDNFSISEKEKEQFKKELIDLWDRYPYEITEDDYTITSKIGPMIEDYIYNTYWKGTDYDYKMVGTRWYSDEHEDFIGEACDAYPIYASEARSSASEPDNGVIDPLPFYRYYNHYEDGYWHIGGAPGRCDLFTTQAIDNRDDGDCDDAYYYIGLASHYLSDVGCPFHTGNAVNQIGQYVGGYENTYHYAYEQYVSSNWDSSFSDIVSSNTQSIAVTDPENAVEDLAEYSNGHLGYMWDEISEDPTGFGDDPMFIAHTYYIILKTAQYNQGLVDYMVIDDWNPWNDPESASEDYITTDELQEAISYWLNDYPAPITGELVSTSRLQALIHHWENDIPMPSGT